MGFIVQRFGEKAPELPMNDKVEWNLTNNWVWVVFRRDTTKKPIQWHLQGVAADEDIADQMALDKDFLIGPVPFNSALSLNRIEWAGSYYPRANDNDDTIISS